MPLLPGSRHGLNGGPEILPRGDSWNEGRPRRQFHLKTPWWLLTLTAVALGLGRWIELRVEGLLLWTGLAVWIWWKASQLYDPPPRQATDQEALREKVRQWQTPHGSSTER